MEKLLEELTRLGLTPKEARIYISFAQNNSDKKKEILSKLDIGERGLIDSLQGLTKKGFMVTDPKDSKTFSVIPLQIVIENLIKEKLREAQEIKGEIKDLKENEF